MEESLKPAAHEHRTVFFMLMMASGMMGAYTYTLRGGTFCNAQTGNLLLMALALGKGKIIGALYYLVPLFAYIAGTIVSEMFRLKQSSSRTPFWYPMLMLIEMVMLFSIGLVPFSVPNQIVQIAVTFLCSMQYNTFRSARNIPMATTFCTNHVRQTGLVITDWLLKKDQVDWFKLETHAMMLSAFVIGAAAAAASGSILQEKTIWLVLFPLGFSFFFMILEGIHEGLILKGNLISSFHFHHVPHQANHA